MGVFLLCFAAFNLAAGLLAATKAVRIVTAKARARWASKRLYGVVLTLAWTFPPVCLLATGLAWFLNLRGADGAAIAILSPIGWLIAFGVLFAVVDFAEDGVMGNGLKPRHAAPPGPQDMPKGPRPV